jgi:hypothetical protein
MTRIWVPSTSPSNCTIQITFAATWQALGATFDGPYGLSSPVNRMERHPSIGLTSWHSRGIVPSRRRKNVLHPTPRRRNRQDWVRLLPGLYEESLCRPRGEVNRRGNLREGAYSTYHLKLISGLANFVAWTFQQIKVPQQIEGAECGVILLEIARGLILKATTAGRDSGTRSINLNTSSSFKIPISTPRRSHPWMMW